MNTLPSPALIIDFKDYEQYHQSKGNKLLHMVGIPLVLFSLLGLLSHVVLWSPGAADALFRVDLGIILFFVGAIYTARIDAKLSVPYLLFAYLNYLLARHLSLPVLTGLQALAWIFQLAGHYVFEKKSPAFFSNLAQLFIGPLWIFAWMIGYYRPTQS